MVQELTLRNSVTWVPREGRIDLHGRSGLHVGIFSDMDKIKGRQGVLRPSDISDNEKPIGQGGCSDPRRRERACQEGRIYAEDKLEWKARNLFLSPFPRNPLSGPNRKTGH